MGLVRSYYNPYRAKIKKAQNGMVIGSENFIFSNPEGIDQPKTYEVAQQFQDQPATSAGLNKPQGATDITGMLKGGEAAGGIKGSAVSGGIGAAAEIGIMGIETFEDKDKQTVGRGRKLDVAKAGLSGAAKGAAAGAVFGPWGAAAGAIIGGTFGAIKAKKEQQQMVKEMRQDEAMQQQEARKSSSKEAQQASNQYLAGLNAQNPSNPYTTPGVKSMKSGGIVAELTGGEYIVPKNWDEAITRASESGDDQLAANIYSMAPKQKTGGKFSHKENPIYVYADGETEDEDGNGDVYAPEGSGVYNPSQHKRMKKGKVKEVMVEQKTKGNR